MSTQQRNNDSSLDNLSESDSNKSSTNGTTGGSSGAIGSGREQEGSSPIGTYDTSSRHNTPGAKQSDSFSGRILGTQTDKNNKSNK